MTFPIGPHEGTHIFDDFHSNLEVADGLVGNLNWERTAINNASTPSYVASPNGIMRIETDGTSGDGEAFTLHPDALVLIGTGQVLRCRVRYPDTRLATDTVDNTIANNNFRIGLSASVTATEPAIGVWIDSAAGVISFDGASAANGDKTKVVTGVPTLTGGTTMILGIWYDFELRMTGTNVNGGPADIKCFVDGYPAGEIIGNVIGSTETMEFSIVHWTSTAEERALDIDYYEAWLPRM